METHFPRMDKTRVAGERVLDDLKTLVADAEALLKATADDVSDKAKDARARVLAALDRAKSTCETLQSQGIESGRDAARKLDQTIRDHPYESIAIAAGAGILMGVLLGRSEGSGLTRRGGFGDSARS